MSETVHASIIILKHQVKFITNIGSYRVFKLSRIKFRFSRTHKLHKYRVVVFLQYNALRPKTDISSKVRVLRKQFL